MPWKNAGYENIERYYIDSGATGQFTNDVMALHDYITRHSKSHVSSEQPRIWEFPLQGVEIQPGI